jgi:molybdopterin-guanine dinucleotide biosynthesis protein A
MQRPVGRSTACAMERAAVDDPLTAAAPLAVVLAGGSSRRFGRPKAVAPLAGRPLVLWAADALRRALDEPVLVANRPELFASFGLRMRGDIVTTGGALAGVHAALRWALEEGRPAALCVACDMPFLDPRLLRELARRSGSTAAWAVVPESRGPRGIEPLCAVYRVAGLPAVEERLARGERSLHRLLAALPTHRLPLADVRRFGDPDTLFLNINTRDQYARAVRIAEQHPAPDAAP